VPVLNLPFRAAVSVSGPSSRITRKAVPAMAPDLQAVAAEVSEAFHLNNQARPLNATADENAS
jgi:IclR family acetate operon transcriptional repressor